MNLQRTKEWIMRPCPSTRHALILVVSGLAYIGIGISNFLVVPNGARAKTLTMARHVMPLDHWAVVFITVGILVIVSSRIPRCSSTWGYVLLTALSSAWSSQYLLGVLFGVIAISNLSGVLIWGITAFLYWAISGMVSEHRAVHHGQD